MAVGGDIIEVTVNHPTLGTGIFKIKSNEGSTFDLGGIRKNDDANQIATDGSIIRQMNMAAWSFELTAVNDTVASKPAAEFVCDLQASPEEGDWTFTFINGTVYGGLGSPVGDVQPDANVATFTLKVNGGGKLKKIV
ncbi:MAG: hypothetical protein BGO31_00130 [Bacteroidetes bacterium 43-16]|uniref:hypothetical protein n=1 Tax=uncultured Dysgonomonas sp. TaxID=206096 RepID=UPI00092BE7A5|nr:hypothetical protein [uncultured Dysgonomonas sp.]OJV51646.1 MAG: hypothetical protein BGO31_00130 [Bacteroidetes bacterium 43-16]